MMYGFGFDAICAAIYIGVDPLEVVGNPIMSLTVTPPAFGTMFQSPQGYSALTVTPADIEWFH